MRRIRFLRFARSVGVVLASRLAAALACQPLISRTAEPESRRRGEGARQRLECESSC